MHAVNRRAARRCCHPEGLPHTWTCSSSPRSSSGLSKPLRRARGRKKGTGEDDLAQGTTNANDTHSRSFLYRALAISVRGRAPDPRQRSPAARRKGQPNGGARRAVSELLGGNTAPEPRRDLRPLHLFPRAEDRPARPRRALPRASTTGEGRFVQRIDSAAAPRASSRSQNRTRHHINPSATYWRQGGIVRRHELERALHKVGTHRRLYRRRTTRLRGAAPTCASRARTSYLCSGT